MIKFWSRTLHRIKIVNNQKYPDLYHIDQNDNLRIWYAERNGYHYRTISGLENGAKVVSEWRAAEAKNIGRANETTPEEQANLEIESIYRDRLSRKYSETREGAQKSNFLAPMLAETWKPKKHLKNTEQFIYQLKFDGVRFLATEDGGHSRSGKPFMTVEHILEKLAPVFEAFNVTLDGELYNHDFKDEFENLISLITTKKIERLSDQDRQKIRDNVQFHIYDVILHDHPSAPLTERLDFLQEMFHKFGSGFGQVIQFTPSLFLLSPTEESVMEAHDLAVEKGYEGIMLRNPNSPYEHKRSRSLVKVKVFTEEEFKVLAIHEGQGNWKGIAKSVTVEIKPGLTSDASMTGTMDANRKVLEEADQFIGGDATVKFQGFTEDGRFRFGVVKKLHKGKRDY